MCSWTYRLSYARLALSFEDISKVAPTSRDVMARLSIYTLEILVFPMERFAYKYSLSAFDYALHVTRKSSTVLKGSPPLSPPLYLYLYII